MDMSLEEAVINVGRTCDDEDSDEEVGGEEEAAQVDEVVDHGEDKTAEQCAKRLKLTSAVWYTAAKGLEVGKHCE